jgi:hypothetical protein
VRWQLRQALLSGSATCCLVYVHVLHTILLRQYAAASSIRLLLLLCLKLLAARCLPLQLLLLPCLTILGALDW